MTELIQALLSSDFLFSIIRLTTPLIFAGMGALIAQKAGITNVGLEGIMLICALAGVLLSAWTQSAIIGIIGSMLIGGFLGIIMGFCILQLKVDAILTGIALNLWAAGFTVLLLFAITKEKGSSISLASKTVQNMHIPFLEHVPYLGKALSGHNILTYMAILSVFIVWGFLYRTPMGLRLRATGENPQATERVGISTQRMQYLGLSLSGAITALGGAYLSMGYTPRFSVGITAGRGFIALAAEIMGNANPWGTMLAAFLFGFADALANFSQSLQWPSQLIQGFPYAITIIGLLLYSIRKKYKQQRRK